MHLVYHNAGKRSYGLKPVLPYPRKHWAFQAIIGGQCSMLIQKADGLREVRICTPVLTVAGGECSHGWGGRAGDECEIFVWHFDEANHALRSVVGQNGFRHVTFPKSRIPELRKLYERCVAAHQFPESRGKSFVASLAHEVALAELTLFLLELLPQSELGPTPNFGERKVAEALAWYEANLSSGPTIAEVAQAVHLSQTHLRRLFHQVKGCSPQAIFTRVQFERAKWLMRDLSTSLESVAETAGFGSASAFSRAFKAEFGMAPKVFRTRL